MSEQPPNRIYLQWYGEDEDTTWCEDQIEENDVAYIRSDEVDLIRADRDAQAAEIARLREALAWYANDTNYNDDNAPGKTVMNKLIWIPDRGEIARTALEEK